MTPKKRRKALLLHVAGEVFEICETLNPGDSDSNYDEVKQGLTDYFQPKKNREFKLFEFRNLKQQQAEAIDQFATRLRLKAENCEISNKDGEIKNQIIQGCDSKKLRLKCLEEDKPLKEILTLARTMEIADRQAKAKEPQHSEVNKIKATPRKTKSRHEDYIIHLQHTENVNSSHNQNKNAETVVANTHIKTNFSLWSDMQLLSQENSFIAVCRKRSRERTQVHEIDQLKFETQTDQSVSDTETLYRVNFLTDDKVINNECCSNQNPH